MAEGILGLGSGQASSLNQELIDKLKGKEREARVQPLEDRIEKITEEETGESAKLAGIMAKANELLETIKPFDLFVSGGVTAFDQKSANVSGTSAIFDAADESALNIGNTTVFIEQLAKRDVFQSTAIDGATKDATVDLGIIDIAIAGTDNSYSTVYSIDTTGKTYESVVNEINLKEDVTASLEQVGEDSYRIVIKSAESGVSNALQITADASLGFNDASNHVQEAKNLKAMVNGVDYDVPSNVITVDSGLKITAVEENTPGEFSSISIERSTTNITSELEAFAAKYNELVSLVDAELYSADSPMEDKASLRSMMEGIKNSLFGLYGTEDNLSIFNYGFGLSKSGSLTVDSSKLNQVVENDLASLKNLFLGVAEDEGLGTQLKTYIDDLDGFEGLLTVYEENMNSRKKTLEDEKEQAIEDLDNKYALLAQQFASYATIITQYESSFAGLKLMIQQSTAG